MSYLVPQVGDRVRLVRMGADPDPIPVGALGTVTDVDHQVAFRSTQVSVDWDSGRTLMLVLPEDAVEVVR